ncbi:MAG: DUF86 domain-containing protein [Cyanophyceae cyanobacterium]
MKRNPEDFLADIHQAIEDIERFTGGITKAQFINNHEKVLATIKLLEIIGEAVKQLPEATKAQCPDIQWSAIAGMRNILVHVYWDIDTEVIWATINESIPPLKTAIIQLQKDPLD